MFRHETPVHHVGNTFSSCIFSANPPNVIKQVSPVDTQPIAVFRSVDVQYCASITIDMSKKLLNSNTEFKHTGPKSSYANEPLGIVDRVVYALWPMDMLKIRSAK